MKDFWRKYGQAILWVVVIALIGLMFVAFFVPESLDGALGEGASDTMMVIASFFSKRGPFSTIRLVITLGLGWLFFWKKFEK